MANLRVWLLFNVDWCCAFIAKLVLRGYISLIFISIFVGAIANIKRGCKNLTNQLDDIRCSFAELKARQEDDDFDGAATVINPGDDDLDENVAGTSLIPIIDEVITEETLATIAPEFISEEQ